MSERIYYFKLNDTKIPSGTFGNEKKDGVNIVLYRADRTSGFFGFTDENVCRLAGVSVVKNKDIIENKIAEMKSNIVYYEDSYTQKMEEDARAKERRWREISEENDRKKKINDLIASVDGKPFTKENKLIE